MNRIARILQIHDQSWDNRDEPIDKLERGRIDDRESHG